jgi:hypothetical protein
LHGELVDGMWNRAVKGSAAASYLRRLIATGELVESKTQLATASRSKAVKGVAVAEGANRAHPPAPRLCRSSRKWLNQIALKRVPESCVSACAR